MVSRDNQIFGIVAAIGLGSLMLDGNCADRPQLRFGDSSCVLLSAGLAIADDVETVTCAVDVNTIERDVSPPSQSMAKEVWRFSRSGTTNRLCRSVIVPMQHSEELLAIDGGARSMVVKGKTLSMPEDTMVPIADLRHLLADLEGGSEEALPEGGRRLVREGSNTVLVATWPPGALLPTQLERSALGALCWRWVRVGGEKTYMPQHETLHLYRDGRIATSIIRAYSNVRLTRFSDQEVPVQKKLQESR
jgi:hypothetical protein